MMMMMRRQPDPILPVNGSKGPSEARPPASTPKWESVISTNVKCAPVNNTTFTCVNNYFAEM